MIRTFPLLLALLLSAQNEAPKGQRILSAGHSFHVFMPGILRELAQSAGIKDHVQVDVQ